MLPGVCVPAEAAEPEGMASSPYPGRGGVIPHGTCPGEIQEEWHGTVRAVPLPSLLQDTLLSPLQSPHGTPAVMECSFYLLELKFQQWRAQDLCEDQPVSFDYQQMEDACKREIIN